MAGLAGRLTADTADLGMTVSVVDHTVATIATVYRTSILFMSSSNQKPNRPWRWQQPWSW